ncbi:hypothetical protein [Leucobacter chromiireducens]|uniref:Uncharacterized protein n=1 Tax=Leucobacter chromiireducens subsp. chromiireducens TaxID=660067 RepID=A0ABS1SMX3_9MICO|nr:hypothetical protein [Leucobacter chromiireducens]MBL3689504.1 hypothetical protein [Leucobacter chromiireducens subsp. chromiireducens]
MSEPDDALPAQPSPPAHQPGRAIAISQGRNYSITYPVGHPLYGSVGFDIDAALDDQYNEQEDFS